MIRIIEEFRSRRVRSTTQTLEFNDDKQCLWMYVLDEETRTVKRKVKQTNKITRLARKINERPGEPASQRPTIKVNRKNEQKVRIHAANSQVETAPGDWRRKTTSDLPLNAPFEQFNQTVRYMYKHLYAIYKTGFDAFQDFLVSISKIPEHTECKKKHQQINFLPCRKETLM